ncbi:MAG: hypothetical protein J6330_07245 [Clostridia bacterium]|nr:hypothetical protein [Clostridia bacterium]
MKKAFGFRWTSLLFYIALCVIIAAGLIAVLLLQKPVREWLAEYEESQPKYEVQRIFEQYFEHPDAATLINLYGVGPEYKEPDTYEGAVRHFAQRLQGKQMSYGYVAGTERMVVNVRADGERIARFSIKPKDGKSERGMVFYELDKVTLYYDEPTDYVSVILPERFTAYAGSLQLGDEQLTSSGVKDDTRDTVPEGAFLFTYKAYMLTGLYDQPMISVKDMNGDEVALEYDAEKKLYSCRYEYSEQLKEEYSGYVLEAMKRYAIYMQDDARFKTVQDYLDPETDLYQNIYDNPNSFVWEHDGYFFENEAASEFFDYGKVMSCRVSFDHHLTKKGREDYVDHCEFTIYLHKIDGVYKIYEMVTE